MTTIIDKRKFAQQGESGNRKKLLERCKDGLHKVVGDAIDNSKIKDIVKKRKVVSKNGVLDEPSFQHNRNTGRPRDVKGHNRKYRKGDRNVTQKRSGQAGGAGDQFEEFAFVLSEKEFLNILFEEMELPNFIKEALTGDSKYRIKRAGTSPEGQITKINLEETLITAIGRRFATKGVSDRKTKPPFLTDEDLRFNLYTKEELPIHKAVMFCMMDVSGSMGDHEKRLAKRFFLLLYLFLNREYEKVDIRFIIHNVEAKEVNEDQFFSVSDGGGTIIESGYKLIDQIITKEYDLSRENIYLAQASDGDDFYMETTASLTGFLSTHLLDKLQYFAYLEVREDICSWETIYDRLEYLAGTSPKINVGRAYDINEVFPVLQNLFRKRGT